MNDMIHTNIKFVPNVSFSVTMKEPHDKKELVVYGDITKDSLADFVMTNYNAIADILKEKGITKIL